MSTPRERLRTALAGPDATIAALAYDPMSARVAEMRGLDVCYLGGSVVKSANFALPDDVGFACTADLAEACRRIMRVADLALVMDVDDGGGSALAVLRTVRELEEAGVAGLEIEDNAVPRYYGQAAARHDLMHPIEQQVRTYEAALAARRDPTTVILARTAVHTFDPAPGAEFRERAAAYAATGVDGLVLPALDHHGRDGRADVEAAAEATGGLPIVALGLGWELQQDRAWLAAHRVRLIVHKDNWAYRMAVKAIDDCFAHLAAGGRVDDLVERAVPLAHVRKEMTRTPEYRAWSERYDTAPQAGGGVISR